VGLALENARLYATLQEYYMSVVKALAAALEAKDKYTQGHSFRVAWWARVIAREMKLSENEQEMVYIGGLLHDIGKVGIREHILLKKGGLTPEEKKEIMTHPRIGAKILKPANLPREVVAAVLYHHEDYNGGGYPEGLTGKRIPLLARIIRVADAYDAMKSDRPYRKAFSQQWIIEELRRCAGKQFDPAVVEAMQKVLEREPEDTIELSREKYLDFIGKLSSLE
jgi:putative nucleotidyltransferase with HDIG domain